MFTVPSKKAYEHTAAEVLEMRSRGLEAVANPLEKTGEGRKLRVERARYIEFLLQALDSPTRMRLRRELEIPATETAMYYGKAESDTAIAVLRGALKDIVKDVEEARKACGIAPLEGYTEVAEAETVKLVYVEDDDVNKALKEQLEGDDVPFPETEVVELKKTEVQQEVTLTSSNLTELLEKACKEQSVNKLEAVKVETLPGWLLKQMLEAKKFPKASIQLTSKGRPSKRTICDAMVMIAAEGQLPRTFVDETVSRLKGNIVALECAMKGVDFWKKFKVVEHNGKLAWA